MEFAKINQDTPGNRERYSIYQEIYCGVAELEDLSRGIDKASY